MKRWLLLALAAAAFAAGLWMLAGRDTDRRGSLPMDQIDDASRAKLREVLREPGEP